MINNGGIIGPKNSPTSSAASGAWSLFEQATAKKGGAWPALTVAPTSVEYLVVAGGGGGGRDNAGGGGAGGFRTATGFAVSAGSAITVTVGAGGVGSTGAMGNNGSNSVFRPLHQRAAVAVVMETALRVIPAAQEVAALILTGAGRLAVLVHLGRVITGAKEEQRTFRVEEAAVLVL